MPGQSTMPVRHLQGGTVKPGGKTLEGTAEQCSGNRGKQLWGTRHTPPWVQIPNGGPPTAMACMLPVCSTAPPSCWNSLTDTPSVPGVQSPSTGKFFCTVRNLRTIGVIKKNHVAAVCGHTHHAAATQAPGTMLLWAKGPVAGFRRYPIAAVCPHVRIGGQRAAPAVVVLCMPTPPAAAAAVYCAKKIPRTGLCTPGVGVNT